ncbi:MAG: hypothetical protein IPL32_05265 [Chloracidobacterium sp.]|nr:hypothetical protein [Chloracidobacterium sp.]
MSDTTFVEIMVGKKIAILFGLLLGTAIIVPLILFVNQSPFLIRIPDPDSIRGKPLFLVLNPFRDKEPEAVAESFFEQLRDGKCLEATADLADEKSDYICRRQIEYPLKGWHLIDTETKNSTSELIYNHMSQKHQWGEDMTIWIEKRGQDYRVIDFVIGY